MTSKRLARLVRLRKLVEQSAAAELSERQRELDEAQEELDSTWREMEQVDQLVEEGQPSAQELVVASRYQGHLQKRARHQQEVVTSSEQQVAEGRDDVREAWRERRLMEGVHERAAAEEQAQAETSERKAHEAIALSIYNRAQEKE